MNPLKFVLPAIAVALGLGILLGSWYTVPEGYRGAVIGVAQPALVELMAVEKWSGALPTTMVPNSTVPFLNMQTNAQ